MFDNALKGVYVFRGEGCAVGIVILRGGDIWSSGRNDTFICKGKEKLYFNNTI